MITYVLKIFPYGIKIYLAFFLVAIASMLIIKKLTELGEMAEQSRKDNGKPHTVYLAVAIILIAILVIKYQVDYIMDSMKTS